MNSFTLGGVPYRVLDMDAERGGTGCSSHTEYRPFAERALEQINQLPFAERQHEFIVAYSIYGSTFLTSDPSIILRFSLAGQVYSVNKRRMTLCNVLAVFYRSGQKFKFLQGWELRHFKSGEHTIFLNEKKLTQSLRSIFKEVKLTLGVLTTNAIACPAWQIESEKGTFYIPWHNGMIIENSKEFTFEVKNFNDVKKNYYEHLKFTTSTEDYGSYKILCC